ncbi:MAG: hypothetical protein KatS3mg131_0444 [Candidatus Tectimicrobiota bacterium]|nr:MAG: hypothetical protein KatS3mg131_0444 [Candidatus Tectomicrobia bacterium]
MRRLACLLLLLLPALGWAAGDLSQQEPVVVEVQLGTADNALRFVPGTLTFETGKLYKLVLRNPSPQKHYFTSLGFAAAVWTRKVETPDAEIKGAIREIELLPGGKAEWYFVPVQAGTFELYCHRPGHREAGMVGTITIR